MTTTFDALKTFVAERCQRQSTCEACGNEFTCGATLSGCWCAEIELNEAVRAELRSRYAGCLCSECLRKFAEAEPRVL